jgi:hypothetical protein
VPDILIQPVAPPAKKPPPVCTPDPCLPPPPLGQATPRLRSEGDLPPRFSSDDIFRVQQALIDHCTTAHDRFALLDPPFDTVTDARLGLGPLRGWRRRFDADCAALYAPWLLVPDPLMLDATGMRAIPPSGHVGGFAAQTDLRYGVHRAPANGALNWVQTTTLGIDDAQHGVLNPEHVNAIRAFAGRGLRIFGARTLSSDPDWRFVNVRRLMLMLEKVKIALRVESEDTDLDGDIQDTIDAAIADMKLCGIIEEKILETDAIIMRAIKTFCKSEYSTDDKEAKRYKESYEMIRNHLAMSTDYSAEVVTP